MMIRTYSKIKMASMLRDYGWAFLFGFRVGFNIGVGGGFVFSFGVGFNLVEGVVFYSGFGVGFKFGVRFCRIVLLWFGRPC